MRKVSILVSALLALLTLSVPAYAQEIKWTEIETAVSPPARRSHAMAYDQSSNVVLVFGGFGNGSHLGDTWVLDMETRSWKNMQPAHSPDPRAATTLVYDPATDQSILFGGFGFGHSLVSNETWSYHYPSNRWTEVKTADAPAGRASYGMALDSKRHEILLFGGFTDQGYFGDLWTYNIDQNEWKMLDVPGTLPAARGAMSLVYDVKSDNFVMFGGFSNQGFFSDTWIFDPNTLTWTELEPDTRPPPVRTRMVYDRSSGLSVFFGGDVIPSEGHQGSPVPYDKAWAFDPSTRDWMELLTSESPTARALNGATYYTDNASVLIFGGTDSLIDNSNFVGREYQDTWELTMKRDSTTLDEVSIALVAIAIVGGGAFAIAKRMWHESKPN